jgi:flagellar biogenesis protein FliO
MPEVIARLVCTAMVAALMLGGIGRPNNADAQDYPARSSTRYSRPDQAGDAADDYGRRPSSAAAPGGSGVIPSGYAPTGSTPLAAPLQPWPEESPQTGATSAHQAGAGVAPGRMPAGVARRALPLRFEPAAGERGAPDGGNSALDGPSYDASQASIVEPAPRSSNERAANPSLAAPADRARAGAVSPALPPPSAANAEHVDARPHPFPSVSTLLGSLAIVVGLFLLVAWLVRASLPKGPATLPREAVEMLGRTLLTGRQYVHLIRCGNKMLLVSVTAGGAETLTEISDPVEVDRLAGICYATRPQSASVNFKQLLQNFGTERPPAARRGARRDDDLDFSSLAAVDQYMGPAGGGS